MKKYTLFFITITVLVTPFFAAAQQSTSTDPKVFELQKKIVEITNQISDLQNELNETIQNLKITRTLRRGIRNDEVKGLQEFLKTSTEIYPEGKVTGFFGPLTEAAVKKFQKEHGIETVGQVGPKTRTKIMDLISEGAGASGKIPEGLLRAPGIQNQLLNNGSTTPLLENATSSISFSTSSISSLGGSKIGTSTNPTSTPSSPPPPPITNWTNVQVTNFSGDGNIFYAEYPAMTWNGNGYGVVWEGHDGNPLQNGVENIFFQRLDLNGNKIGEPIRLSNHGYCGCLTAYPPNISWNGTKYGVVWEDVRFQGGESGGDMAGNYLRLVTLDANGNKISDELLYQSNLLKRPGIKPNGTGFDVSPNEYSPSFSATTYSLSGKIYFKDGTLNELVSSVGGDNSYPFILWTGAKYSIIWMNVQNNQLQLFFGTKNQQIVPPPAPPPVSNPETSGGFSIQFSGNEFLLIDNLQQKGLDLLDNLTIEAWVNPNNSNSVGTIASKEYGPNENQQSYRLYINDGVPSFHMSHKGALSSSSGGTASAYWGTGGVYLPLQTWTHITVTWTSNTGLPVFYINGKKVVTAPLLQAYGLINPTAADFTIGADWEGTNSFFSGKLEEVRVWNTVRSDTQISSTYNKELSGNETGLVGYWRFNNDLVNGKIEDYSPSGNHLTTNGSPTFSNDSPILSVVSPPPTSVTPPPSSTEPAPTPTPPPAPEPAPAPPPPAAPPPPGNSNNPPGQEKKNSLIDLQNQLALLIQLLSSLLLR